MWPQENFVGPDGDATHGPCLDCFAPFDLRYAGRLYLQPSGL